MLCSFDSKYSVGLTFVENPFFTEFLPVLSEEGLRVYLYGLYLCGDPLGTENTLEKMSERLSMPPEEIKKTFRYLKSLGLVDVVSATPFMVKYNSAAKAISPNKLYNKDKYSDFLVELHTLFGDRELSETEILGYLDFLEDTRMEQAALLLITKYCVDFKGSSISRSYVLTVAKNWFNEGVRTLTDAENRVLDAEASSEQIKQILKALKSVRSPDITDRQLYIKWTTKWDFSHDAILAAAKLVKKGGMDKLDSNLESYQSQGVNTADDIKTYAKRRSAMLDCAIKAAKVLGLFYEDYSFLIDNYVSDWFSRGYTVEAILKIARYCALTDVRTFSSLADTVNRFFQEGYVTEESISLQLDALTRMDDNIRKIMQAAGLSKHVTVQDRDLYRTWTEKWRLSDEQIIEVAREAQGKAYAMSWISSRLADVLGGSPWKIATDAPKVQKTGIGDFEKAEIKEKLKQDREYYALITDIKKLEFEASEYLVKGETLPVVISEKLDELREKVDDRIRELGYDPEKLK